MANRQLLEPLLAGGIQNINYFNGRLLGADDLRADQEAGRRQRAQLGMAIGAGVVYGLEVTLEKDGSADSKPVLKVESGLALNRRGQALELPGTESLALVGEAGQLLSDAGLFHPCKHAASATLNGAGVYVLALSPASGYSSERAPGVGLDTSGSSTFCGSRYALEGVQFKLVAVGNLIGESLKPLEADTSLAARHLARSNLARICFGIDDLGKLAENLFTTLNTNTVSSTRQRKDIIDIGRLGLTGSLLGAGLDDCDVPLAILYWGDQGVMLLDRWAMRRQVAPVQDLAGWQPMLQNPQQALREAIQLQFQEQVAELAADPLVLRGPATLGSFFSFLPAAGIMPKVVADKILPIDTPLLLQRGEWRALLDTSLRYDAYDLTSSAASGPIEEFITDIRELRKSRRRALAVFVTEEEQGYPQGPRYYLFATASLARHFIAESEEER